jgi:hypothetical protein
VLGAKAERTGALLADRRPEPNGRLVASPQESTT